MNDKPVLDELKRLAVGHQITLANKLGISQQYMSDILSGRRSVSEKVAERIGFERVWRKKK